MLSLGIIVVTVLSQAFPGAEAQNNGATPMDKQSCIWQVSPRDNVSWETTQHTDGVPAEGELGSLKVITSPWDAQSTVYRLRYRFASKGHDAIMMTLRGLEIEGAQRLSVGVAGDAPQLELFVVLEESSGEKHLVRSLTPVNWEGMKTIDFDLEPLRKAPPKHSVGPDHWEGDGNQVLDDPIVAITIGFHDRPDAWMGSGEIHVGQVRFW